MPESIDKLISPQTLLDFDQLALKLDVCTANFEKLIQQGVQLNSTLGNTNGIKNVNAAFTEIGSNERDITRNTAEMIAVQDKLTQSLLKRLAVEKEVAAMHGGGQSFTSNLADLEKERQSLVKKGTVLSEVNKLEAEAANSAVAYSGAVKKVTTETRIYLGALQEKLRKEQEQVKLSATRKYLDQQQASELKNQVREELAAKGSLDQRQAALIRLTKAYGQLTAAEREQAHGQRLEGIVSRLSTQVKGLEANLGNSTRNVGNYTNAITNGFSKAFGYVRQLAYILPGIGIAGIFGLIIEGVTALVEAMFNANEKISLFKENLKNLNDVMGNANKESGKQIADLKILYVATQNVNLSLAERKRATHALQVEFPETFGKMNEEIILNGKAKDAYYATAAAIIATSRARAAKNKIDELESHKLDLEYQRRKVLSATTAEYARALKTAKDVEVMQAPIVGPLGAPATGGKPQTREDALQLIRNRREDALHKIELDRIRTNSEEEFLAKFAGVENIIKATEDLQKGSNDKLKVIRAEFNSDEEKAEADKLKKISESENFFFKDRIRLRQAAADIEKSILRHSAVEELALERDKLNSVLGTKGSSVNDRTNAENEFAVKTQKIREKAAAQLKKIESDLAGDLLTIRAQYHKNQIEADLQDGKETQAMFKALAEAGKKDEETIISDRLQTSVDAINTDRDFAIAALEKRTAVALRSAKSENDRNKIIEKAQKERVGFELEADRLILLAAIKTQRALLDVAKDPKERDALVAKIAALEKALEELGHKQVDIDISKSEKKLNDLAKAIDGIKKGMSEVFGLMSGVISASIIRDKNTLQDQADQIDINAQKEIDAVNATTDSQEKKAARIAIIQARQQAQRAELDRKTRQLQTRQAEFDKAQAIASIVINTAAAVVSELRKKGLFGAILAAALGAAQLAIALSTPIPRFGYGTLDAPGGPAEVGDRYKSEMVITPEGRLIQTPATPTVMNVPKHSIILPDARRAMEAGIGRDIPGRVSAKEQHLLEEIRDEMRLTRKTIGNKRENHFYPRKDGWERITKSGGNRTSYLNDNLQF